MVLTSGGVYEHPQPFPSALSTQKEHLSPGYEHRETQAGEDTTPRKCNHLSKEYRDVVKATGSPGAPDAEEAEEGSPFRGLGKHMYLVTCGLQNWRGILCFMHRACYERAVNF